MYSAHSLGRKHILDHSGKTQMLIFIVFVQQMQKCETFTLSQFHDY